MQWFANVKMSTKLFIGFGIMLVLIGTVIATSYRGITRIEENERNLFEQNYATAMDIREARLNQQLIRIETLQMALTKDRRKLEQLRRKGDGLVKDNEKLVARIIEREKTTQDLIGTLKEYERELTVFAETRAKDVVPAILAGKADSAIVVMQTLQAERTQKIADLGDKLDQAITKKTADRMAEASRIADASSLSFMLAGLLATVLAIAIALLLNRLIAAPLGKTVEMIQEMRKGKLDTRLKMNRNDEVGILAGAMDRLADTVQDMAGETNKLAKAAVDGRLSTRGDASKFEGAYRDIVQGVNDTLDAVIGPLNVAADYVDKISRGAIPAKITDTYNGDFNTIKNNLNNCIDNINALVADAALLVKAAVEGKLATRADASRHQGDYRKIVQGVNDTLDAVIGPLNVAAGYVDRIAKDDVPRPIDGKYNGDFDVLKTNLNKMSDNLRGLNKELQGGFGVLASSSAEILATVSQVAAGASETATAVSETASTVEEVKQTAHLFSQKAKAVQETAQKSAAASETGRKAVSETVEGMNRIREQMEAIAESVVRLSEQGQAIGEIIATVNDLAEQSNLLAVNAAIEATRAGEYGKGFGVVAQEVKSLAEQSRRATTQVRTILMEVQKATSAAVMANEQGTKAVAAGVKQAADAGESIRVLTGGVREAENVATQIAASSQQQLVGMDQIASAIANIRQATAQNMAGAKQLETSAKNLQELGGRLKVLVERQRVEG
jgi:methyl-accepting chemotaxis protein